MRPLSPVDLLLLNLEKRQQPMHVGGLFLFRPPEGAPDDFVYRLIEKMRAQPELTEPVFPFNQVLEKGVLWREDDEFDIDHHFRHISLPRPGRVRELLVYVSKEHSQLLERSKPLWECHVIEGIEDNRFAIYFKIHHALVDGVAAMRLMKRSFSTSPYDKTSKPFWGLTRKRQRDDIAKKVSQKPLGILKSQLATLPTVTKELASTAKEHSNEYHVSTVQAPKSLFNQSITSARRVVAQSYAINRFKRIARHFGITLNDVVLAVCAGALREYLLNRHALPKKPLVAFVPVSLRTDKSASGNQISFMLANLATHIDDPTKRLHIIVETMRNAKERFARMNQSEIINYSAVVYALIGMNLLSGFLPKRQGFNLIISNVPGATESRYWNGARLDALYPISLVMDGQALNITLASYVDKLEFCFTASARAVPKAQSFISLLESQIAVYEQLCS